MRNILVVLLLLVGTTGAEAAMHHVTGAFEVKITPVAPDTAHDTKTGRMAVAKTYDGDLTATANGEMQTSGSGAGSGAYVMIEQVDGTLDGRRGGFALAHIGIMDRGKPDLHVTIVPGSGTGELAGLSGTMTIRIESGKHFYDLDYEIAPR